MREERFKTFNPFSNRFLCTTLSLSGDHLSFPVDTENRGYSQRKLQQRLLSNGSVV